MELTAVVLALAPFLAEHLYTAWRRRKGKTDHQAKNLRELIARDHQNQLLQKEIERDVEALAEHIVESLEPIFELDGATLTSSDLDVVITRLAETIRSAGISPRFLLERRLDPLLVARSYREALPSAQSLLSERQSAFFDACIEEIARRLVALADQLPGFGTDLASELIRTQGLILSQGKTIIETLVAFSEANKSKESYLLNNFDLRFAHAVRHRFGNVHILGLDPDIATTRLSLNTSYISLRVETASKKRHAVTETDISSEAILHHSKRAPIRGHAGSGKTTLLQWIAIQCVDKALPPPAEVFNGHAPLMVRLRDFHGRPLPTGHELLSTTSSALTELDPGDWFKDRLHRGRFIFLIDGLDEVSEDQRRQVARWLEDLIMVSPNSSYMVTTRPSAIDQGYLSNLDFDDYFLKPMTPAEVHSFVEYWHEAAGEAAIHDEERRKAIFQKRAQLGRLLEENRDLIRNLHTEPRRSLAADFRPGGFI